ncbi:MAG: hypothetical protein IPM42_04110 [Saprospiraceae bacterium]|nr:hypothetical protein [Saprospiraceae bacterium]
MKKCFVVLLSMVLSFCAWSQDLSMPKVEYAIVAEGQDAPIPDLHITCFNKYFNQDYLPADFRKRYNLDNKVLYKNKMLVEIFRNDISKKGFDKIELVQVKENKESFIIEYKLVNADFSNDEQSLSPFLIIQLPKSKKKVIFIADGVELSKAKEIYVD